MASENNLCTTVTGFIEVTYSGRLLPSDVNPCGVSGGTTGPDAFLDVTIEEGAQAVGDAADGPSEKLSKSGLAWR